MATDQPAGEMSADDIAALTRQAREVLATVQAQADELRQSMTFLGDLAAVQQAVLGALPAGSIAAVSSSASAVSALLGKSAPYAPAYGGGAISASIYGAASLTVPTSILSGAGTLSAAARMVVTPTMKATAKVTPAADDVQKLFRHLATRGIAGLTGKQLLMAAVVITALQAVGVAALELPPEWQLFLGSEVGLLGLALAIIGYLPRK
jgi:hypothetical protein